MNDDDGEPLGEQIHYATDVPPELRLWQAVIIQAAVDARCTRPGPNKELASARNAAIRWFTDQGWQFRMVCDLAGLDAERVAANFKTMPTTPIRRNTICGRQ